MGSQIIEVAIRSPRAGVSREDFLAAKTAAVSKLVSLKEIGPEREFKPVTVEPQPEAEVFVGMTRYGSLGRSYMAMMNFGFMTRLMAFMKRMDMHAGVLLRPDDPEFSYSGFASPGNVLEISLQRPREGVREQEFFDARRAYRLAIEAEEGVVGAYTFTVAGGFKLKDTVPHFVVYRDIAAFNAIAAQSSAMSARAAFEDLSANAITCVCEAIG